MDKPKQKKIETFFLASSEGYNLEEPRKCRIIKRLSYENHNDFALIEVDPPILYRDEIEGDLLLSEVIIASRHIGFSVFEIHEWPISVYVLRLKKSFILDDKNKLLKSSDLENIAWAELYPTEESARLKRVDGEEEIAFRITRNIKF